MCCWLIITSRCEQYSPVASLKKLRKKKLPKFKFNLKCYGRIYKLLNILLTQHNHQAYNNYQLYSLSNQFGVLVLFQCKGIRSQTYGVGQFLKNENILCSKDCLSRNRLQGAKQLVKCSVPTVCDYYLPMYLNTKIKAKRYLGSPKIKSDFFSSSGQFLANFLRSHFLTYGPEKKHNFLNMFRLYENEKELARNFL